MLPDACMTPVTPAHFVLHPVNPVPLTDSAALATAAFRPAGLPFPRLL